MGYRVRHTVNRDMSNARYEQSSLRQAHAHSRTPPRTRQPSGQSHGGKERYRHYVSNRSNQRSPSLPRQFGVGSYSKERANRQSANRDLSNGRYQGRQTASINMRDGLHQESSWRQGRTTTGKSWQQRHSTPPWHR